MQVVRCILAGSLGEAVARQWWQRPYPDLQFSTCCGSSGGLIPHWRGAGEGLNESSEHQFLWP